MFIIIDYQGRKGKEKRGPRRQASVEACPALQRHNTYSTVVVLKCVLHGRTVLLCKWTSGYVLVADEADKADKMGIGTGLDHGVIIKLVIIKFK